MHRLPRITPLLPVVAAARRSAPLSMAASRAAATPVGGGGGEEGGEGLHSEEGDHYKNVSASYATAFFYTGEYEDWQKGHILRCLRLAPEQRLVDIGGGTGRFAHLLHEAAALQQEAVCVDPSASMLEEAAALEGVATEHCGGVEWASKPERYDRALIKEVVHHLTDDELGTMYGGIFNQVLPKPLPSRRLTPLPLTAELTAALAQLSAGGVCLTCTRPDIVEYPFFDAALEVWKRQQPPMEHYVGIMERAGFSVSVEVADYPATLGTEWWLEMVANRFWSTFSHFSDEELAAGIEEIKARHGGAESISFTEKMVFITATKPA